MKTLIPALFALIALFSLMGSGHAGEFGYKELQDPDLIIRLEAQRVNKETEAAGMETYHGQVISLQDIKKRFFQKKTIAEVLSRSQIELSNGEIVYPEEVRFALVPRYQRGGGVEKAPHEKAPHLPE
jgi:hypothetical protein